MRKQNGGIRKLFLGGLELGKQYNALHSDNAFKGGLGLNIFYDKDLIVKFPK